jgi:argininosuccinate lyase
VSYAIDQGKSLHQIDLSQYKSYSPLFEEDVYSITLDSSIKARNIPGGTAPQQVEAQLAAARRIVEDTEED